MRRLTISSRFCESMRSALCFLPASTMRSTRGKSWALRRPQAKAARLKATAVPFNSMACSSASSPTGNQPFW
ncbi:hypothetical protein D3C72_1807190 [compost metagenome]